MQRDLQSVEASLRYDQKGYAMQGQCCVHCGRTHPMAANKCRSCKNLDLIPKFCTSDHRVAEYFSTLRSAELWPSLMPFKSFSASDIAFRISCARKDLRHDCAAGKSCPLELELKTLEQIVRVTLDAVAGLSLDLIN